MLPSLRNSRVGLSPVRSASTQAARRQTRANDPCSDEVSKRSGQSSAKRELSAADSSATAARILLGLAAMPWLQSEFAAD